MTEHLKAVGPMTIAMRAVCAAEELINLDGVKLFEGPVEAKQFGDAAAKIVASHLSAFADDLQDESLAARDTQEVSSD